MNIQEVPLSHFYFYSPIGFILVNFSDQGIYALQFADMALSDVIIDGHEAMKKNIECDLMHYFEKPNHIWTSKIICLGTDFQLKVWNEIDQIKPGTVSSYLMIATQMNHPKASQAVGNATGKNSILLRIPCHRVIGSQGNLVGYRGELWRKEWLLKHEGYLNPIFVHGK